MFKPRYIFPLSILLITVFTACHSVQVITVSTDGSVQVEGHVKMLDDKEVLKLDPTVPLESARIWKSDRKFRREVWTHCDSLELYDVTFDHPSVIDFHSDTKKYYYHWTYRLNGFDSLGQFLDPVLHSVNPTFAFCRDSFSLVCPPTEDSLEIWAYGDCIFAEQTYVFPWLIDSAYTNNPLLRLSTKKNRLHVFIRMDRLCDTFEDTEVRVYFKK